MASRTTAELLVRLSADASGLQKTLGDASASTRQIERSFSTLGKSLEGVGTRLSLGLTLPLAAAAAVGVSELMEQGKVAAQTAAVLKSTGGVANVSAKHLDTMSQSLMKKTGFDDEAIKSGANLLLTFKNVRNEAGAGNDVFDRATEAAADLSVAFGQDLNTSSKQLGKALEDPINGVTALRKVGVSFSGDQRDMIRSLVETGDVAGAQKIILKELETQVGGSAEAYGKTLPGQISIAKQEFQNASGAIMASFAPAMTIASDLAGGLATTIGSLPEPVQTAVGVLGLLFAALGPVTWIAGKAIGAFGALQTLFSSGAMQSGIANLTSGMTGAKGGLLAASAGAAVLGQVIGGTTGNMISLAATGAAIGTMINPGIGTAIGAVVGLGASFLIAGGSAKTLKEKIGETNAAIYYLDESIMNGSKIRNGPLLDRTVDSFKGLIAESPKAAQAFIDQSVAAGTNSQITEKLQRILDKTTVTQGEVSAASINAANKIMEQGRSAELTASQIKALTDALTAQANIAIAVEQAQINSTQALDEYNRVLGDGTSTTIDRAQATLNLEKAAYAQRDAIAAAADADKNGVVSKQEQIDSNNRQIFSLTLLANAMEPGSPARVRIEEMIVALQNLNNTPVRPQVSLETSSFIASARKTIEATIAMLNLQPDSYTKAFQIDRARGVLNSISGFAEGGSVGGNVPILVGERGPEIFMPPGNGSIIPNHKLGGGSTTNVITINSVAGDAVALERAVVDALARARRRGLTTLSV